MRLRLAKAILGSKAKDFIKSLNSVSDGWGSSANVNDYLTKSDQLTANVGWCFAANDAIAEPTAAVKLKLYKKLKNGKREEIIEHELLTLLDSPNLGHTGEMRHSCRSAWGLPAAIRDRGGELPRRPGSPGPRREVRFARRQRHSHPQP